MNSAPYGIGSFHHTKYSVSRIAENPERDHDEGAFCRTVSTQEIFPGVRKGDHMLRWTLIFLVISIVAAVFGFGGVSIAAAGMARILFFIFLVLFLVSLLGGLMRRV